MPTSKEHEHLVTAKPLGHWLFLVFHRHRTALLAAFLASHYAIFTFACCTSDQACDPFALEALRGHFRGWLSVLQQCLPSGGLLSIAPLFLCRWLGLRWLALGPLFLAWRFAYTTSMTEHWGAATGLWLSMLIVAWGMKTAAFIAQLPTHRTAIYPPLAEWLRYLFLSPSLVWAPSRRLNPPRVAQALTEFFHAALVFLAMHVMFLVYMRPGLHALKAAWTAHDASKFMLSMTFVAALCLPTRALSFYGFWHCCGSGLAYLGGDTDLNLYGPWWLVDDSPPAFFRRWSRPVHVWLKQTVHVPLRARLGVPLAAAAAFAVSSALHEAVLLVALRAVWPVSTLNLVMAAVLTPVFEWWLGRHGRAVFTLFLHVGNVQFVAVTWLWWLAAFGADAPAPV